MLYPTGAVRSHIDALHGMALEEQQFQNTHVRHQHHHALRTVQTELEGPAGGDTTTQQDLWERGEGGEDATQWLSAARLQASARSGKEVKRDCKPHRYPPPCPSGLRLFCRVVIMTRCMQPASTASFAAFEAQCIGVGVVGGGDGCWWWRWR